MGCTECSVCTQLPDEYQPCVSLPDISQFHHPQHSHAAADFRKYRFPLPSSRLLCPGSSVQTFPDEAHPAQHPERQALYPVHLFPCTPDTPRLPVLPFFLQSSRRKPPQFRRHPRLHIRPAGMFFRIHRRLEPDRLSSDCPPSCSLPS